MDQKYFLDISIMDRHIDILKKGVVHWNSWRTEYPSINPDLSYEDIINVNLSGVNLSHADLSYVNLYGEDLSYADLSFANFTGAILFGAELIGADLSGANLTKANLSGADLTKANITKANFSYTDLTEADLSNAVGYSPNFSEADLTKAILFEVNLPESNLLLANLSGANLIEANLSRSNLTEANFSYADLHYSILSSANLHLTNFKLSKLGETIFSFSNLNTCKNLETIIASLPCSIDFTTLKNSPDIPKMFLSKVGLSDNFLAYLPELFVSGGVSLYPAFLSHSSNDKVFTTPLYERLTENGVDVWYDEKKLRAGDIIREEIHKGISLYDKMILVCSKSSLSSWWVEQEIDRIEEKEREYWKQHGEKISLIIPISIDDEVYISNNAVAPNLRKRLILDFRNPDKYDKAVEELVSALNPNRGSGPISMLKSLAARIVK